MSRSVNSILIASLILACSFAHRADAAVISWAVDADGSWNTATNWSSNPTLPGSSDDVTIDRPAGVYTVTHSTASTTINSLFSNENLILDGAKSLTVKGSSVLNGELDIRAGSTLYADGPGASFVANGATTLDGANVRAKNGATISLPNAIAYTELANPIFSGRYLEADGTGSMLDMSALTSAASTTAGFGVLRFLAYSGGTVDVSGLTGYTTGSARAIAADTDSIVDLSGLTSFTPMLIAGEPSWLQATVGGTVLVPNLTVIDQAGLTIDQTGSLATAQITDFTRSAATIDGYAPDFSGMTNVDGSRFQVNNGATLTLPNVTSYHTVNANYCQFVADGTGSIFDGSTFSTITSDRTLRVYADNGGLVDISTLATYNSGELEVVARDTGSIVDLSSLTNFTSTNAHSRISVFQGGTILVPNLTHIHNAGITISGTGVMNTAQITTFTNSTATVSGTTADFSGMTNIDGSSLWAGTGGAISLPNITTYESDENAYRFFRAGGSNSVLDLSTISTFTTTRALTLHASGGGFLDLTGMVTYDSGEVHIHSEHSGSIVDLSSLTRFESTHPSSQFTARNGGRILAPNLTSFC